MKAPLSVQFAQQLYKDWAAAKIAPWNCAIDNFLPHRILRFCSQFERYFCRLTLQFLFRLGR
jgi:hypothetical protein